CPPVILVSLPIHLERQCRDLLIRHVGIAGIENLPAGHFLSARGRSLPQALLNRIELRIRKAVAANAPRIEHAERRDRLEALVGLRAVSEYPPPPQMPNRPRRAA